MRILILTLITVCILRAETPYIGSIVNSAARDSRFSPGVRADLTYGFFTPYSGTVLMGGRQVEYSDQEDGSTITIQVPLDFPLGPTTVVLDNGGSQSQPFPITIDAYAPGIFAPTRSASEATSLTLGCNSPALPGEMLSVFGVGLGAIDGNQTAAKLTVFVGGVAAEVVDTTVSGSFFGRPGGTYRVRFLVPPGEGLHLVSVSIGGFKSNPTPLPVGRTTILNYQSAVFKAGPAAAESIQTAVPCSGGDFVQQGPILSGKPPDLPTSLGDVTFTVKDSAGVERLAPLYAVVSNQVNYVVPAGTAPGIASVTAKSGDRLIGEGDLFIDSVAPSLFFPVQVVRYRNGEQIVEIPQFTVVDMGPETDDVYLVVYGTGIRSRSSLSNVTAKAAGIEVPVAYAGPQGAPGLDQINLHLPRTLVHRGAGGLEIAVDGKPASNNITLSFN
jgi:uncharacterized protein (TIGR03437 family)